MNRAVTDLITCVETPLLSASLAPMKSLGAFLHTTEMTQPTFIGTISFPAGMWTAGTALGSLSHV